MPELPEVETIRRSLQPLIGATIRALQLSPVAPLKNCAASAVAELAQRTVVGLHRRGKFLLVALDRASHLVLHLGMSGQLRMLAADMPLARHTHLRITFEDRRELRYIDPRRFGGIGLCQSATGEDFPGIARLGPELNDARFTPDVFVAHCRRHPLLNLKALCLDQRILAGLGNIYACEALYCAALSPTRLVRDTPDDALARLLAGARRALQLGIDQGGTTLKDYVDGLGHRGKMQDFLQVYDREGRHTLDGRGSVVRITQQGRSTWWCPEVQV